MTHAKLEKTLANIYQQWHSDIEFEEFKKQEQKQSAC